MKMGPLASSIVLFMLLGFQRVLTSRSTTKDPGLVPFDTKEHTKSVYSTIHPSANITASFFNTSTSTASSAKQIECPATCTCQRSTTSVTIVCKFKPRNSNSTIFEEAVKKYLQPSVGNITQLYIQHSILQNLSRAGICGLKRLKVMQLDDNKIDGIPDGCFNQMPDVWYIDMSNNLIEEIKDRAFHGIQSLQHAEFHMNRISKIGVRSFINHTRFYNLTFLGFRDNILPSVDIWPIYLGVFNNKTTDKRMKLDLKNNRIATFTNNLGWHYSCFRQLPPAWIDIDLTFNHIHYISSITNGYGLTNFFDWICLFGADQFRIDITENPFVCDCTDFKMYRLFKYPKKSDVIGMVRCGSPQKFYDERIITIPLNELVCDVHENCTGGCKCINIPSNLTFSLQCQNVQLQGLPMLAPDLPTLYTNYRYRLDFQNNLLYSLDKRPYLHKSRNADFSYNLIEEVDAEALQMLLETDSIKLNNNKLKVLPAAVTEMNFTRVSTLSLHGNPWDCTCDNKWMRPWLESIKHKLDNQEGITCSSPHWLEGMNMFQVQEKQFCENPDHARLITWIVVSTVSVLVTFLFGILPSIIAYKRRVAIYAQYKWHPFESDECKGENKRYDGFLVCHSSERPWVQKLVAKLEGMNFRLYVCDRDTQANHTEADNMGEGVDNSKRTICIVSKAFLADNVLVWGFNIAFNIYLKERQSRLILIKYDDITKEDLLEHKPMQHFLRRYEYLDTAAKDFMDQLVYYLPFNRLGEEIPDPVAAEYTQTDPLLDN